MRVPECLTEQELDLSIEAPEIVGGPLLQSSQRLGIQAKEKWLAGHVQAYW
jgi:hypothetical protein